MELEVVLAKNPESSCDMVRAAVLGAVVEKLMMLSMLDTELIDVACKRKRIDAQQVMCEGAVACQYAIEITRRAPNVIGNGVV